MSLRYSSPRPNLDLIKHICPFNSILPKISIPKLCPIRWLTNDEIEILPMLYPGVGLSYPMFIIYRTFFNKGSYLRKREFDLFDRWNFVTDNSTEYTIFQCLKRLRYQSLQDSTEDMTSCPNIGALCLNFTGMPRCWCLHTFLRSPFSC